MGNRLPRQRKPTGDARSAVEFQADKRCDASRYSWITKEAYRVTANPSAITIMPSPKNESRSRSKARKPMVRLRSTPAEVMDPAYVDQWLDEPNEMLAVLKPLEAIERGGIARVREVVEGLRWGAPR